ncbi:hypothetical protein [Spirulina major]|uniref:hypothetical protein n=1 Tax=Spirulina major TaxID=270636 RepID=UPI000934B18A|nr:hypothetical protein [Spirulina major]
MPNIVIDLSSGDMLEAGFVGEDQQRTAIKRSSPGLKISDMTAFENDLNQVFSALGVRSQDCKVLLSQSAAYPYFSQREAIVSLLFDKFGIQGAWVMTDALLGLFATGSSTGVATICNSNETLIVPYYSGMLSSFGANRMAPNVSAADAGEFLFNSVMKCDFDIRAELYNRVILMGDNVPSEAVAKDWENQLRKLAPRDVTVKMTIPDNYQNLIWQGGSLAAAHPSMADLLFTMAEYQAYGVTAVHRKTL